jgi:chloride channel protein, CIC family
LPERAGAPAPWQCTTRVVAYPDEPLRVVVYRMVETGLTQFPVVARGTPSKLLGLIALDDLLVARQKNLEEERRRERVLPLRPFSAGRAAPGADEGVADRSG